MKLGSILVFDEGMRGGNYREIKSVCVETNQNCLQLDRFEVDKTWWKTQSGLAVTPAAAATCRLCFTHLNGQQQPDVDQGFTVSVHLATVADFNDEKR